ncbi:splicing regulator RBM11-like [Daphnia carinata]|uniref:splicing regulator RBM11-like n=1 Tax=Daphnia carinata TaxID=120202 RepID=UPI00257B581E|nr:splicing regulator RBM11-like [Daphnia carinata]
MDSELCTIYCGSLSPKVTEELLYELFLQAGPLKSVKIPKTLQGESKSFGFIEYQHECSVDYAIQLFHHTTLFGQELQLKRRKQNNPGHPPTGQMSGMHRTSSLPVMMNFPMQASQLFYRPPFLTDLMYPPIRNMLNYGLVMTPPMVPCHLRFDEAGLPNRDFVPTSAILNVQCNDIAIPLHQETDHANSRHKSSHEESGINKRRKSSNSSFNPSRQEYDRDDKKARYSHSDKPENHRDRQEDGGSEARSRASCNDLRETRRFHRNDHRSSRRDYIDIDEDGKRRRWDEHSRSRSRYDDRRRESRSRRDRPENRERHYID